jgi:competence CoiA-like predicted nuclease
MDRRNEGDAVLKALLGKGGSPIEASAAVRGVEGGFVCPLCKDLLILKQGRIIVAHFAHMPGSDCAWGSGETLAHLTAKQTVADSLRRRGWPVWVEYIPNATRPGASTC